MTVYFKNTVPFNLLDICAICRDDFTENSVASGHPLSATVKHVFHTACVGPWLAQHHICPICRARVGESIVARLKPCLVDGAFAAFAGLAGAAAASAAAVAGAARAAGVTEDAGTLGAAAAVAVAGVTAAEVGTAAVVAGVVAAGIAGAGIGAVGGGGAVVAGILGVGLGAIGAGIGGVGAGAVYATNFIFNRMVGFEANRENASMGLAAGCLASISLLTVSAGLPTVLPTIFLTCGIAAGGISAFRHFIAH